jgi:hypothetical protein
MEAEVGGNLQKTGRKAEISNDLIILGFWENRLYSSYTQKHLLSPLSKPSRSHWILYLFFAEKCAIIAPFSYR